LIQYCREQHKKNNSIDFFIFGHRHLPIDHKIGMKSKYINLGDWIDHNTYAVLEENELTLQEFKGL